MRYGLLALGIAACIGIHWLTAAYQEATGAALSDEARSAIELRCKGLEEHAARECRGLLEKLYLASALDPERTLRAHCTRSKVVKWRNRQPAPPELCVERYGGWQRG